MTNNSDDDGEDPDLEEYRKHAGNLFNSFVSKHGGSKSNALTLHEVTAGIEEHIGVSDVDPTLAPAAVNAAFKTTKEHSPDDSASLDHIHEGDEF